MLARNRGPVDAVTRHARIHRNAIVRWLRGLPVCAMRRRGPQRGEDTRRPAERSAALDLIVPDSAVGGRAAARPCGVAFCPGMYLVVSHIRLGGELLWAGARRGVRVDRVWSEQALSIFVPAISRGSSRRGPLDVKTTDVVAAAGETSVEVLFPEGPGGFRVGLLLRLVAGLGD